MKRTLLTGRNVFGMFGFLGILWCALRHPPWIMLSRWWKSQGDSSIPDMDSECSRRPSVRRCSVQINNVRRRSIPYFFEGVEKAIEIWFSSSEKNDADLTMISVTQWEGLLKHVHCEIISETRDEDMVSYVLSESSMFISRNRFILKTCGTTTLLHAVKPLLKLVKEECGMDTVEDVFYSRKKFERPDLQHHVHQNFEDEVALLDELFKNGAAYALGRLNGECWYLYTLDLTCYVKGVQVPDQTLELLMQDLDPGVMTLFTQAGVSSAEEATRLSGIEELIPDTIVDDFLFEPCGYSMNGILPKGHYFTIHVTPEPDFSYVSFETNVPQETYHTLISKVLKVFKPGKFVMTIFANKESAAREVHKEMQDFEILENYKRQDHQLCQFKNYSLTYAHYASPTLLTSRPKSHSKACFALHPAPPI